MLREDIIIKQVRSIVQKGARNILLIEPEIKILRVYHNYTKSVYTVASYRDTSRIKELEKQFNILPYGVDELTDLSEWDFLICEWAEYWIAKILKLIGQVRMGYLIGLSDVMQYYIVNEAVVQHEAENGILMERWYKTGRVAGNE